MNALRWTAAVVLALGLLAGARAEDKKADIKKENLFGSWEVTKADEGAPQAGSVLVFEKDGKMKITHKQDGKEVTADGTYIVEGDKLTVTVKQNDKENKHTVTIKKLTDTEMVAENEKGMKIECKKKK